MSGKRKPLLDSPKDSSNSSSDDDTISCNLPSHSKGKYGSNTNIKTDFSYSPSTTTSGDICSSVIDFDDDSVASPSSSSTASGPVYIRPPGFEKHGQEVTVKSSTSKGKKKKAFLGSSINSDLGLDKVPLSKKYSSQKVFGGKILPSSSLLDLEIPVSRGADVASGSLKPPPKIRREPLPMKLRALPQSFWQQPNVASNVSPGQMYTKLPPLISKDSQDVEEISPIAIQAERDVAQNCDDSKLKDANRVVKITNIDWLYKLFDGMDGSPKIPIIKRGRPKKAPSTMYSQVIKNDDPCLGTSAAEDFLLPALSHEKTQPLTTLTMVSLRDRDKSVSLPSLHIERNYSQLLSELVVKL